MSDLRPPARQLLDAARRERTPSAAERSRLIGELLAAAAESGASSEEPPVLAQRLGAGAKLVVLAVLLLLIVGATYVAHHLGKP